METTFGKCTDNEKKETMISDCSEMRTEGTSRSSVRMLSRLPAADVDGDKHFESSAILAHAALGSPPLTWPRCQAAPLHEQRRTGPCVFEPERHVCRVSLASELHFAHSCLQICGYVRTENIKRRPKSWSPLRPCAAPPPGFICTSRRWS